MAERTKPDGGGRRSWWLALALLAGLFIYAYGFEATQVNLDQIRSETRRVGLVRILRALASPDLIEYDEIDTQTEVMIQVPCTDGTEPATSTGERQITVAPGCAEPRATVLVTGSGFARNQEIRLSFIPSAPVELRLADIRSDAGGEFSTEVRLPNRPDEAPQIIRATSTEPVGDPRLTRTASDTLDKIIETVFLALIATTVATLLAIPLSFLAARNLMKDITSPLTNVALGLLAAPVGVVAGVLAARGAGRIAIELTSNPLLATAALIVTPLACWWLIRRALPPREIGRPTASQRATRAFLMAAAVL
ncbi:MAG TPA: hypothetical protein VLA54_01990, partial [Acidimicrobiia bacterium]|nr:hypothetical protein [Acidimicrobiia bacterium]